MTLPDLALQLQRTRRFTVSPTAARQFAALRASGIYIRSGVLFGRWPAGGKTLLVEAATPAGGLEWRQSEQDHTFPFTVQPTYVEGCHDMLCAQSDFPIQRVGYWAVLPPVPVHQLHRPTLNAILTQHYNQGFLDAARDESWLTGPEVVMVVREQAGRTDGHAYVFDSREKHRLLEMHRASPWPSGIPLPITPALLWLADDQDRFWPV